MNSEHSDSSDGDQDWRDYVNKLAEPVDRKLWVEPPHHVNELLSNEINTVQYTVKRISER